MGDNGGGKIMYRKFVMANHQSLKKKKKKKKAVGTRVELMMWSTAAGATKCDLLFILRGLFSQLPRAGITK